MNKKLILILSSLFLLGTKCSEVDVTDPKVAAALTEINASFRSGYQEMLTDMGTRHFNINRSQAFTGMLKTLKYMGFTIINTEGDYYIFVSGIAPTPLNNQDWKRVQDEDETTLKKIAYKHLGIKGNFAKLEPEGLNIEGYITIVEVVNGIDITITFRLREIKPQSPESILPRREYPPPTAARIGYEKIWHHFEKTTVPLAKFSN